MVVEIDLFNDLDITKANNFLDHIKYISGELVHSVVNCYLIKILGNNYEKIYFYLKDFLSIISMYYYPKEFLLNNEEKKDIAFFMNNIFDLNKNYKNVDIYEYVEENIKPFSQNIKSVLTKIMDNNRQSICENYSKIYNNLKNLEKDIADDESKNNIKKYKEHYYKLLNEILLDNTDSYLEQQKKLHKYDNEYDNFRKTIFMDNLKKDLCKTPPVFNGVIYLIDIIRKKLCFISPVHSKYDHIKEKINSILDIDYFKQLANNNVFDNSNLLNVFQFIVEKITEFQAESDSEKMKEWVDTIKKDYLDNFTNDKLPVLMDMILKKIEELELNVSKYREHIYKNMNEK